VKADTPGRNVRRAGGPRWLALTALVVALGACGGRNSLTGGSIPVGRASLKGIVVRAENTNQRVAGATLTLSRDGAVNVAASAADGAFDFGRLAAGRFSCRIDPPVAAFLDEWKWDFDIEDDQAAYLIAALWPKDFNLSTITGVTLAPATASARVGETLAFTLAVVDLSGRPAAIRPSLLLLGDVGELSPDGRLKATRPGTALLVAWLDRHAAVSRITVNP